MKKSSRKLETWCDTLEVVAWINFGATALAGVIGLFSGMAYLLLAVVVGLLSVAVCKIIIQSAYNIADIRDKLCGEDNADCPDERQDGYFKPANRVK